MGTNYDVFELLTSDQRYITESKTVYEQVKSRFLNTFAPLSFLMNLRPSQQLFIFSYVGTDKKKKKDNSFGQLLESLYM